MRRASRPGLRRAASTGGRVNRAPGWVGTAVTVAATDLRIWRRQWIAPVTALLLPALVAAIVSTTLGSLPEPKASWAIVDLDGGAAAQAFEAEVLDGPALAGLVTVRHVDRAEAERLVADGDVDAALVLPAGMTADLLVGRPPQIEVLRPRIETFGADLADLVARQATVRSWAASVALVEGGAVEGVGADGGSGLRWPIEVDVRAANGRALDAAGHYGPAIGLFFVMLSLGFAAQAQVTNRETGIMQRLDSTSVRRGAVLLGHAGAGVVIGGLSLVTTLAVMSLVFGHGWGALAATAALVAAVLVAYTGIAALIAAAARTAGQATLLAVSVPFAFALASGTFAPPGTASRPSFAALAPPTYALDAFAELGVNGAGVVTIGGQLAVLVACGLLCGGGAALIEERR